MKEENTLGKKNDLLILGGRNWGVVYINWYQYIGTNELYITCIRVNNISIFMNYMQIMRSYQNHNSEISLQ